MFSGYDYFYFPQPASQGGTKIGPLSTESYNAFAYALWRFGLQGRLPDGTPYFEDLQELRNWLINREQNRKLEDLVNVQIDRPVRAGDTLQFDDSIGKWVLVDFISGGTW